MIGWLKALIAKPAKPMSDPISLTLPEGVTYADLAEQGIAHLAADKAFDDLVNAFMSQGLSAEDADVAADRIAGGMTRALMFGDRTRPNKDHDPLATIAFDLMKSRLESEG